MTRSVSLRPLASRSPAALAALVPSMAEAGRYARRYDAVRRGLVYTNQDMYIVVLLCFTGYRTLLSLFLCGDQQDVRDLVAGGWCRRSALIQLQRGAGMTSAQKSQGTAAAGGGEYGEERRYPKWHRRVGEPEDYGVYWKETRNGRTDENFTAALPTRRGRSSSTERE